MTTTKETFESGRINLRLWQKPHQRINSKNITLNEMNNNNNIIHVIYIMETETSYRHISHGFATDWADVVTAGIRLKQ